MVTKGIIKSIDFNGNSCIVHMPYFETAGSSEVVCEALISNVPGIYNGYKENDVVWVAFEDGSMETPVVIGKLYLGASKEKQDPRGTVNCVDSSISGSATIPSDTKLNNDLAANQINTTIPYQSLKSIANNLTRVDTEQAQNNRDLGNRLKTVVDGIGPDGSKIYSLIEQTTDRITNVVGRKVDSESGTGTLDKAFGWDLTENYWRVFATSTVNVGEEAEATKVVSILVKDGEKNIIKTYVIVNGVRVLELTDANKALLNIGKDETNFTLTAVCVEEEGNHVWKVHKVGDENHVIITDTLANTKTVLKVTEDGLVVNGSGEFNGNGTFAGDITATKGAIGKFIIGEEHDCDDTGNKESGIYSAGYIDKFEIPATTQGVYVGTDGIKLGTSFYIKPDGEIGASKFSATFINTLKVGTNIQDGNNNVNDVWVSYYYKALAEAAQLEQGWLSALNRSLFFDKENEIYLLPNTCTGILDVFKQNSILLPDIKQYLNTNDNLSDYVLSFKYRISNNEKFKNYNLKLATLNSSTGAITEIASVYSNFTRGNTDYIQVHVTLPNIQSNNYSNIRLLITYEARYHWEKIISGRLKEFKIERNTIDLIKQNYSFSYSEYDKTHADIGGVKGTIYYNQVFTNTEMENWQTATTPITFPNSDAVRRASGIDVGNLFNVQSTTSGADSKVFLFYCICTDLKEVVDELGSLTYDIIGRILDTTITTESGIFVYKYTSTTTNTTPTYTGHEEDWIDNIIEPGPTTPYIWQITGYKKANITTFEESSIIKVASATGIINILSASTIDNKNIDLLFYDSASNQYHLRADHISGAMGNDVKIGQGANDNFFTIKTNNSDQGQDPSAIFSPSTFNSIDSTGTGIYLGTDGINVGGNFKVKSNGTITATGLIVQQSQVQDLDTALDNAAATGAASAVSTIDDRGYQTASQVTTITENTIQTGNLVAENLHVKAANIDGTVIATKLTIIKDSTVVFNADADDPTNTSVGGFYVKPNELISKDNKVSLSNNGLSLSGDTTEIRVGNSDGSGAVVLQSVSNMSELSFVGNYNVLFGGNGAAFSWMKLGNTRSNRATVTMNDAGGSQYKFTFTFSVPLQSTRTFRIHAYGHNIFGSTGDIHGTQYVIVDHNLSSFTSEALGFGFWIMDWWSLEECSSAASAVHAINFDERIPTNTTTVSGHFVPSANAAAYSSYTLGSTSAYWKGVYGEDFYNMNGPITTSDINKKLDINYNLDTYDNIFDSLRPATFKYTYSSSNRTHIGLIAQDVKQAVIDNKESIDSFAPYCSWNEANNEATCGLRYSEFIALNIDQIQKLKKRVIELEEKLNKIEKGE